MITHKIFNRAKNKSASLRFFRRIRSCKVVIFHPDDDDLKILTQQLHRIGCQSLTIWPPVKEVPDDIDAIFWAVRMEYLADEYLMQHTDIPVIAIINYENPTVIDAALHVGAKTLMSSPIRPIGVLSSLVMAFKNHYDWKDLNRRMEKLSTKLRIADVISQAKVIISTIRGVDELEAYAIIREMAMNERMSIEDMSKSLIRANELLQLNKKKHDLK
ncbi:ANTAR domain-containing response regulator [Sodalis sp. RH23]|uniref:ANTAR domain-containing response regulator n=1 Tax=unclassified Sodalis (in: enterobacteria) TaxID=2636512 RepID=UPI0039B5E645